jgi:DNA repair protein RadC
MIRHELRLGFFAPICRCRHFWNLARCWTGARHGGSVPDRPGGLRHCWNRPHARWISLRSDSSVRSRFGAADRTLCNCDRCEPMVDRTGGRMPTGCGTGSCCQIDRACDDPAGLLVSDHHLVMADGWNAGPRHLDASEAASERDYRSGLEGFLRASSVAEPARSAAKLSARYATLSELLSADPILVADYAGAAAAQAIAAARRLMIAAIGEELGERRAIVCERDAARFLTALIGFRSDELLIVLFLDRRRRLIDHEVIAIGTTDSVDWDQRRIVFRAIGRGASGIIVAHNHPSGDPRPSSTDISLTRRLADVTRSLGICMVDHLVIAGGEVRSAMFSN